MKALREFDIVRVLGFRPGAYLDLPDLRPPRIGETGTILDIRENGTGGRVYTAEMVDDDGCNVWLCDFLEGELEWISSPGDGAVE
ncbi:MAG TPA: hypothetical protein VFT45_17705 [Longimicrobium sp.]|nr:hypothetical protein [Longimicrobium sp.]